MSPNGDGSAAVLQVVAGQLARDAVPSLLVVRGRLVSDVESYGGPPVAGSVGEVDPRVVRFATVAGALIDPWIGPGSPWQASFFARRDSTKSG